MVYDLYTLVTYFKHKTIQAPPQSWRHFRRAQGSLGNQTTKPLDFERKLWTNYAKPLPWTILVVREIRLWMESKNIGVRLRNVMIFKVARALKHWHLSLFLFISHAQSPKPGFSPAGDASSSADAGAGENIKLTLALRLPRFLIFFPCVYALVSLVKPCFMDSVS